MVRQGRAGCGAVRHGMGGDAAGNTRSKKMSEAMKQAVVTRLMLTDDPHKLYLAKQSITGKAYNLVRTAIDFMDQTPEACHSAIWGCAVKALRELTK